MICYSLARSSSSQISEDNAHQGPRGNRRDKCRQDANPSHCSQKAMLQPCVHHHRRGGVHFEYPTFPCLRRHVSLTGCVTFSPRQVSRSVTSGPLARVSKRGPVCVLLTPLTVLAKEHCTGVKWDLMRDDRGDTDRPGLATVGEGALARWEAAY